MTLLPYTGRTTIYSGVTMRSRLEGATAAAFDRGLVPWEYEPCAFQAPDGGQYLPDFRIRVPIHDTPLDHTDEVTAYVEVKPDIDRMLETHNSKVMHAIKVSAPSSHLIVTAPATSIRALVTGPSGKAFPFAWSRCVECQRVHLIVSEHLGFKCCDTRLTYAYLLPLDYWKRP